MNMEYFEKRSVKVAVSTPEGAWEQFEITKAGHPCTEEKPNNNALAALKYPIGKKTCQGLCRDAKLACTKYSVT